MIVSFNPNMTVAKKNNKKQVTNFAQADAAWVQKIVKDPGGALNNGFHGVIAFKKISLQTALDTLIEAKTKLAEGFHGAIDRKIKFAQNYLV